MNKSAELVISVNLTELLTETAYLLMKIDTTDNRKVVLVFG